MDHQKRKRYKTERTVNGLLVLIGFVVVGLNIFQLWDAVGTKDDFSIFRRIIYIVVFGLVTGINLFRYRKGDRLLRAARNDMQHPV